MVTPMQKIVTYQIENQKRITLKLPYSCEVFTLRGLRAVFRAFCNSSIVALELMITGITIGFRCVFLYKKGSSVERTQFFQFRECSFFFHSFLQRSIYDKFSFLDQSL